jgi:MFS transporter, DHA1 family, inner membrane transport protein
VSGHKGSVHGSKYPAFAVLCLGAFTAVLNGVMMTALIVPISEHFHRSESATGQLVTVTAITVMIVALLAAPFVDRVSRNRLLRGQAALVALAAMTCAVAPSFGLLAAGRLLAGIAGAVMLANVFAATGDLYREPEQRNRALGILVSAATVGIVIGLPAIAKIEELVGWRVAVAAIVVPSMTFLVGTRVLPEREGRASAGVSAFSAYASVLRHRPTIWMLIVVASYFLVYGGWLAYFGVYVEEEFDAGASTLGALFLVAGLAELVANNVTPLLLKRFRPASIFVVSGLVWTVNLGLTGIVFESLLSVFVAVAITGSCACVLYVTFYSVLLGIEPERRGTVMSLVSASTGLGYALGAVAGGAALSVLGDVPSTYRLLAVALVVMTAAFVLNQRPEPATSRRVAQAPAPA